MKLMLMSVVRRWSWIRKSEMTLVQERTFLRERLDSGSHRLGWVEVAMNKTMMLITKEMGDEKMLSF
jgi:hypothetical protein